MSYQGHSTKADQPQFKRYLSGQNTHFDEYVRAAKEYPQKTGLEQYMYFKPFDDLPGNTSFYDLMFDVLNLLKAMEIPPMGTVLEVGCGSGWITEILMSLGFAVDAIEPSDEFIRVAQQRLQSHIAHHHIPQAPRVTFHNTTLEETDLPDNSVDAIIFYAALHHIIDEEKGIAQCMRLLRPGGVVGISELAWIPGDKQLESAIETEMAQYHTLENPFTPEYLDQLLKSHNFSEITRYYQVNGLFDESMGSYPLKSVAVGRPETHNIVIARKGISGYPTTQTPDRKAHAQIRVENWAFDREQRQLSVRIYLFNDGEVAWLHRHASNKGWVSIALYRGELGQENYVEAQGRWQLSKPVLPNESLIVGCLFRLPFDAPVEGHWYVDLVNEGFYFFSLEGTKPEYIDLE